MSLVTRAGLVLAMLISMHGPNLFAQAPADAAQKPRSADAPGGEQRREALERQVRQVLWRLTRERVGLTDAQMAKLAPINQRFEGERRALLRQERQTRVALRQALVDSAKADPSRVAQYLDQLIAFQRQRVDILEREQKELAQFMTPEQRAKYLALQEQVRRRVEAQRRAAGRR